jgi:hypothetical protein
MIWAIHLGLHLLLNEFFFSITLSYQIQKSCCLFILYHLNPQFFFESLLLQSEKTHNCMPETQFCGRDSEQTVTN